MITNRRIEAEAKRLGVTYLQAYYRLSSLALRDAAAYGAPRVAQEPHHV